MQPDRPVDNAPYYSLTHAGLTVEGWSRAAVQSYWRVPELKIGFDLGAQPWDFMGTPTWFISHTHLDHVAALPVYVARRRMMKMEPPTVYVPAEGMDGHLTTFALLFLARNPAHRRELVTVEPGCPRHLADARRARAHDLDLPLERGVVDPVVQAATLQGVVQVARAVARDDDRGRFLGGDAADLRDRHRELREDLEQERLELVVGAVELVHEEDRPRSRADRLEERALEEELRPEEFLDVGLRGARCAHRDELAGVVPLVERLRRVDALVALEPDEPTTEERRQDLGDLGLADTGLALEEQRPVEREREEDGRGESAVGQVALRAERRLQFLDRRVRECRHVGKRSRARLSVAGPPPPRGHAA